AAFVARVPSAGGPDPAAEPARDCRAGLALRAGRPLTTIDVSRRFDEPTQKLEGSHTLVAASGTPTRTLIQPEHLRSVGRPPVPSRQIRRGRARLESWLSLLALGAERDLADLDLHLRLVADLHAGDRVRRALIAYELLRGAG